MRLRECEVSKCRNCFLLPSEKRFKGNLVVPEGSKFFPFRVGPVSEVRLN